MSWLLNFSTRTKLVLGFGFILAMMLLAVMSGYQGITAPEAPDIEVINGDQKEQ